MHQTPIFTFAASSVYSEGSDITEVSPQTLDMTTLQTINNKYFNIAFWNVNSLLNKIDHLQQFIKDKSLSVVGISETKMDLDTHPSAYAIPG